jgi:hypothetical protein
VKAVPTKARMAQEITGRGLLEFTALQLWPVRPLRACLKNRPRRPLPPAQPLRS